MRKKKTIVEETLPEKDEVLDDESITDMVTVLSKVHKLNGASRSFCFVSQEPVDEVIIQAQYPAGGKFVVTEYNSLSQVLNSTVYEIEPKTLTITNGNGHSSVDQMMREELAWSRNMIMQMIAGMFQNRGNNESSIGEIVQAVQGIHSLGGKDPVELLIKGMELGAKVNGGGSGDWKSDLVATAKEVLPQVVQVLKPPSQPQPQQIVQEQPMIETNQPSFMVRQGIQWVKSQILAGLETGLAVEWLMHNANKAEYQPLVSLAIQGNIDHFIAIDSEIANEPFRTWFTNAIQEMKDAYAEQQSDVETDIQRGNGNSSDVANNAKSDIGKPKIKKAV